jgi:Calpain family cysteine protease/RTX calcium-binding nonapeptide repeat (4 copies)
MAADISLTNGVLRVDGSDSADRITAEPVVEYITSTVVTGLGTTTGFTMPVFKFHVKVTNSAGAVLNGADGTPLDRTMLQTGITRVDVLAGAGSDKVTSTVSIPIRVYGGDGNDSVTSGVGNDTFYGQAGDDYGDLGGGDDYFSGYTGNDFAYGWDGDDRLYGGDDNDTLYGERGNDSVRGDDGNDSLHGGYGDDTLEGGNDRDTLSGSYDQDILRGDSGDDALYGDAGRDSLYGGAGADLLSGGDNNDVLVSVGGGQFDTVQGNDGTDTFWVDSEGTEQVSSGSAETVQRIGGFRDLRVFNNGQETIKHVGRDLNGEDLIDPATDVPYHNFSDHPLFNDAGPAIGDVDQGGDAHDCYFMSVLAGLAKFKPDFIARNVVDLGDGTYAVHFKGWFGIDEYVRVDGDLPSSDGVHLDFAHAHTGAIWAPIMEKAWAFYRRNEGTYLSINYGNSGDVFGALGISNQYFDRLFQDANSLMQRFKSELAAGKIVTAHTQEGASGEGIVEHHVYLVDHLEFNSSGQVTGVVMHNPRGGDVTLTPEQVFANFDYFYAGAV